LQGFHRPVALGERGVGHVPSSGVKPQAGMP
jgi:hypothetical protein